MKLIVAFRNFANAPKNRIVSVWHIFITILGVASYTDYTFPYKYFKNGLSRLRSALDYRPVAVLSYTSEILTFKLIESFGELLQISEHVRHLQRRVNLCASGHRFTANQQNTEKVRCWTLSSASWRMLTQSLSLFFMLHVVKPCKARHIKCNNYCTSETDWNSAMNVEQLALSTYDNRPLL